MSPAMLVGAVALAGGVGAVARYALDAVITARAGRDGLPWGTIVINLSGSLALGLVAGLAAWSDLEAGVATVAGAGFLGGYTTFSTASVETVRCALAGRYRDALLNGLGVVVASTVLAAAGWGLAALLST